MPPFSLLTSELIILSIITTLCVLLGALALVTRAILSKPTRHHTALVLVLGDVGRSPRMMYHASSLAKHDWIVSVVGYDETPVIPLLAESPRVAIHGLANPPRLALKLLPWVLRAPLRVVYQTWSVLHIALWRLPFKPEILLVQNPPSIPTLALVQIIRWVTGTQVIIDWHNTGCSILALRVGQDSPLVKVATWFEATYGRKAYAHLFVTRALKDHLVKEWNLEGRTAVLHDRPPAHFHRSLPMDEHEALQRLSENLTVPLPTAFHVSNSTPDQSRTSRQRKSTRPALVVSSTSWTADEDFTPLVSALDAYQAAYSSRSDLPKVLVIITGKGALRAQFESIVAEREAKAWKDVCVRCAFVPSRDYPLILGSADLGISVHSSSSGLDLPMKIVDMFGCGTPVLARGFKAVGELVKDGVNGRIWMTPEDLGGQLIDTLTGFPSSPALAQLQTYFDTHPTQHDRFAPHHQRTISADMKDEEEWCSWDDNWDRVMHRGVLHKDTST